MRISDWSSDVCSSDLVVVPAVAHLVRRQERAGDRGRLLARQRLAAHDVSIPRSTRSARCVHREYIATEGCRPSSAPIPAPPPPPRLAAGMSTKAPPRAPHVSRSAALTCSHPPSNRTPSLPFPHANTAPPH